jgi:hypothetical protein
LTLGERSYTIHSGSVKPSDGGYNTKESVLSSPPRHHWFLRNFLRLKSPLLEGRRGTLLDMLREYQGTIVQESLKDESILKDFIITEKKRIGEFGDEWNLAKVKASLGDIAKLKYYINDGPWYANFWNADEHIVVFKDKVFTNEDEAREYGLSVGVPPEQLDFKKE